LFHDESTAYSRRLADAGVPCSVEIVPGAFHGFDLVMPNAPVGIAVVLRESARSTARGTRRPGLIPGEADERYVNQAGP
jgi:acetyl esterase/lipase